MAPILSRAATAIALAGALLLTLSGGPAAGRGAAAAAPGWRVSSGAFRLSFLDGTRIRAVEAATTGGPGGRLGYGLVDGSFHGVGRLLATTAVPGGSEYRVATDEPGRTAIVTVRTAPGGVDVGFRLEPATGVVETFEAFAAVGGEHFLGGGERPGPLDLSGQALAIKTSYSCQSLMPAPFFLSSAGYGVALESTAVASLGFPGADPAKVCAGGAEPPCPLAAGAAVAQLCAKSPQLAYRLFLGPPQAVVSAYTRLVGRPRIPPPSELGLIKWRDSVSGPSQLLEDVDRLHALGIPIGWVLLDNPWESDLCYGTLSFDAGRFPDPAGTIAALHGRGVRFMLWISPLARRQWCPPPAQYASSALIPGTGNAWTLDLTQPPTLASFEAGLERLISLGVDGFKADRGDEIDLEGSQLAGGSGALLHNEYPLLYARAVDAAVRTAGEGGTFATLFRSGAPGSSAVATGVWAGDQLGTFDGLRQAIHDGLSAGVAGYPMWGSDTGGYANAPPEPALTPEVFVRWAQLSAVSPVFEVGGVGESATFWDFGEPTIGEFRDAAVLHYELFPYLYGLLRAAHSTGLPALRPLALAYPDDPNAWRYDLEALVGPSLLAAPVSVPASGGVAQAQVYLPAGAWVDLASGRSIAGGRPFVRPTPLSQLPLYLKAGSAVPFAARTPAIWAKPWPTDALTLAGRGGWLLAPAQGTTRASDSSFGRLVATGRGSTVDLRLSGAPRETQILVAGTAVPRAVEIGGRTVPRAASATALARAASGWLSVEEPFRGTVLKLGPVRGAAAARLTFG